jgi:hypothetical protein
MPGRSRNARNAPRSSAMRTASQSASWGGGGGAGGGGGGVGSRHGTAPSSTGPRRRRAASLRPRARCSVAVSTSISPPSPTVSPSRSSTAAASEESMRRNSHVRSMTERHGRGRRSLLAGTRILGIAFFQPPPHLPARRRCALGGATGAPVDDRREVATSFRPGWSRKQSRASPLMDPPHPLWARRTAHRGVPSRAGPTRSPGGGRCRTDRCAGEAHAADLTRVPPPSGASRPGSGGGTGRRSRPRPRQRPRA